MKVAPPPSGERRIPPHNTDAEASILGAVLLRNSALGELDVLTAEDFYDPKHAEVYEAMQTLMARSTPIDPLTLEDQLRRMGKLNALGGIGFLSELVSAVPTADNVRYYADIVRDLALARRIITTASDIAAKGFAQFGTAREYLAEAMARFAELASGEVNDVISMRLLVHETMNEMHRQMEAGIRIPPGVVTTGFPALDYAMGGGLQKHPVVLGGRPGLGKSALARSIADNAAAAGAWVVVFSPEDDREVYAKRALSDHSGVNSIRLRTLDLDRNALMSLATAADRLYEQRTWMLDDTAGLSIEQIAIRTRAVFQRLRALHEESDSHEPPRKLVIIDYLQLVRQRGMLERERLEHVMLGIQQLSREERMPVLVLSQLTRANERENRPPTMADLRGDGSIEQIAKTVLFVHQQAASRDAQEFSGVIIGKANNAPPGRQVRLHFDGATTTYRNPSAQHSPRAGAE